MSKKIYTVHACLGIANGEDDDHAHMVVTPSADGISITMVVPCEVADNHGDELINMHPDIALAIRVLRMLILAKRRHTGRPQ